MGTNAFRSRAWGRPYRGVWASPQAENSRLPSASGIRTCTAPSCVHHPAAGYRPPAVTIKLDSADVPGGRQSRSRSSSKNATRWTDALRHAGAEVVMTERAGSHGGAFWKEEFVLMVAWAFG